MRHHTTDTAQGQSPSQTRRGRPTPQRLLRSPSAGGKERLEKKFAAILGKLTGMEREGDTATARCPAHESKGAGRSLNLTMNKESGKILLHCFGAGCSPKDILTKLGLKWDALFADEGGLAARGGAGITLEEYAEAFKLPLEFLRKLGLKEFRYSGVPAIRIPYFAEDRGEVLTTQYRRSLEGLEGPRLTFKLGSHHFPYGLWRIGEAKKEGYVILAEGASDTQTLWYHGFPAVGIPGANAWKHEWADYFSGIDRIYVIEEPGKGGASFVDSLAMSPLKEWLRVVKLHGLKDANALHLDNPKKFKGRMQKALRAAVTPRERAAVDEGPIPTVQELEEAFSKHLLIVDPYVVKVVLAVAAAHYLKGDPIWLALIGAPSTGKTELISPLEGAPNVHLLSTLTPNTLLSGWQEGRAGLLTRLGEDILFVQKDFGSIFSLREDQRNSILAMLREAYDGYTSRDLGNGVRVEWRGKLSFIVASTEAFDSRQLFTKQLGDRFVCYRITTPDPEQASLFVQKRQRSRWGKGEENAAREHLTKMVSAFLRNLPEEMPPPPLPSGRLAAFAAFVVRARSAVVRGRFSRDIEQVPKVEGPSRFTQILMHLDHSLHRICPEMPHAERWKILRRIGLDSIQPQRLRVLQLLMASPEKTLSQGKAQRVMHLPSTTMDWVMHELEALRMLAHPVRKPDAETGFSGNHWKMSRMASDLLTRARVTLRDS